MAAPVGAAVRAPAMKQRAEEIGARVRSEDGVGRAVELFNQYVDRFTAAPTPR